MAIQDEAVLPRSIFAAVVALAPGLTFGQTICIDPGHPSEVGSGTHGRKVTEIQVAYKIGQRVATELRREGYNVVLTKSLENTRVTNRRRAEIANDAAADLFLRLHCDAATGSGYTVYYPGQEGVTASGVRGPSAGVIKRSRHAAESLFGGMQEVLKGVFPSLGLKTDAHTAIGAKQGALTGSIFAKVPTVLIEMVVLTNPKDEDWIVSKDGAKAMTQAICRGVERAVPRRN